ncbi:prepilin-type N-terminal cleavage/methylation domain-containing protein [Deinococcus yavapaiensis KR-236]|uniref:Prepilin-type N-terminal cleavage/methylation domain-containing protein n=1 Tax=Deinococcus yavapaiensis KR-236 TaxID=694435 RepID=A0A318SAL0_9DEIO|nr:prepilin-type N-terminal cleavage/methylation domain-containing protein [Deinococcus yavapaiensis KR-236]
MNRARQSGFTLIEAVIALLILGLGIMWLVSALTSSYQINGRASGNERATMLARTEMNYQRGLTTRTSGTSSCAASTDSTFTCSVTITPCTLDSSTGIATCSSTATSPTLDQVAVTVTRPGRGTVSLTSLVFRQ